MTGFFSSQFAQGLSVSKPRIFEAPLGPWQVFTILPMNMSKIFDIIFLDICQVNSYMPSTREAVLVDNVALHGNYETVDGGVKRKLEELRTHNPRLNA